MARSELFRGEFDTAQEGYNESLNKIKGLVQEAKPSGAEILLESFLTALDKLPTALSKTTSLMESPDPASKVEFIRGTEFHLLQLALRAAHKQGECPITNTVINMARERIQNLTDKRINAVLKSV